MSEKMFTTIDTEPVHGPVPPAVSDLSRMGEAWARQYFAAAAELCSEPLERQPPFAVASDGIHVLIARAGDAIGDPTITMHEVRTSEGVDEDGCITLEWVPVLRFFPPELSCRIAPLQAKRKAFVVFAMADALAELASLIGRPYAELATPRVSVHCLIGGAW